jgi:hypothetical protein
MTPTAHYGDERIQAQVAGSGLIWLRAGDLPNVAMVGPDLAPPAPRPVPASVPTAAPAPCRREHAAYVVTRQMQAGTLPIGEVTGWSCASAAEAEAAAATQEQQMHASYAATTTTKTSEAGR